MESNLVVRTAWLYGRDGSNFVETMRAQIDRGAGGLKVVDAGIDVSPEQFVDTARESGADVIGMSALLTTTMPGMKQVISLLKEQGLDSSVRTMVGGAPVTREYANEIGADGYGFDAANAVECVRELMG